MMILVEVITCDRPARWIFLAVRNLVPTDWKIGSLVCAGGHSIKSLSLYNEESERWSCERNENQKFVLPVVWTTRSTHEADSSPWVRKAGPHTPFCCHRFACESSSTHCVSAVQGVGAQVRGGP